MAQPVNLWSIKIRTDSGVEKTYGMETAHDKEWAANEFRRRQAINDKDGNPLYPAGEIISVEPMAGSVPDYVRNAFKPVAE